MRMVCQLGMGSEDDRGLGRKKPMLLPVLRVDVVEFYAPKKVISLPRFICDRNCCFLVEIHEAT